MGYRIAHDYHAYHHSGNRPLSAIRLFVVHDMEAALYDTAAEAVGRYFESAASGGSSQWGLDNSGPIQQYLSRYVIPWGAPNANADGLHAELMGMASWTRAQWFSKARGTLNRCAWLIAYQHDDLKKHGVSLPIRTLTDAQLRAGAHGVTTHRQVTRALGGGTHTDPGTGFPLDWVIAQARKIAA
jgi:hypothetical protein